jgi:hypothetical protein
MACIVFEGTQKPKNGVGDWLRADVRFEVKINLLAFVFKAFKHDMDFSFI